MERLFESVKFYINSSTGELRLNVIYVEKEMLNKVEKDIQLDAHDINNTEVVIELANKLLDKAGV